ncbi:hypothetical protein H5410_060751 [Solanum commersonii]|uniref:Uncharacterized protein n=1 Tax=Solanum commersonii TaxID=4109 RepID=A0A9J5W6B3_SOLCO|nr:hypothetical protein H5410_060751 [Solanum commersonii]
MEPKAKNVAGSKQSRKGEASGSKMGTSLKIWEKGSGAEQFSLEVLLWRVRTRFLRAQGIEEAVDLAIAFHPDLTERQARDDSVIARMFGMAKLQQQIGGRPITEEEIETMAELYRLTESAAFLCRTGPAFLEPLDDDEAIDDE